MSAEIIFALNLAFKIISKVLPIPEMEVIDNGVKFHQTVKGVKISLSFEEDNTEEKGKE